MKELKKECGVTRISMENISLLVALHGPVRFMLHFAPIERVSHATMIGFQDGTLFRVTGFSSGFAGEGPHGLHVAIEKWLDRRDITIRHLDKWYGARYLILSGKGNGQRLYYMDDHTEVW